MEEKKGYKISLLSLILLVINLVLIFVVIGMAWFIHHQNLKLQNVEIHSNTPKGQENIEESIPQNTLGNKTSEKVKNSNVIKNSISNNNQESSETSNDEYVRKVVETRPYVYDAGYLPEGLNVKNYSMNNGTEYSIENIVVPYVNMVSVDSNNINSKIEEMYKGLVEEFKVCSQNKTSFIKTNYTVYNTSNIYSILITIQRGQGEKTTEEYVTYNFDIISGTKLEYNQVCYIAGIDNASDSVTKNIENLEDLVSLRIVADRDHSQEEVDQREAKIVTCQNQIYTSYQQDLLNNQLVYFLDNNLKLNIVLHVVLPDNEGNYDKIVIVEA